MEQVIVASRILCHKLWHKVRVTYERRYVDSDACHDGMTATTTLRRVASQDKHSPWRAKVATKSTNRMVEDTGKPRLLDTSQQRSVRRHREIQRDR
jgi:hypothetical protein